MKLSINAQAELELTEGAVYYAQKANKLIAEAFLAEFERSARLLDTDAQWHGAASRAGEHASRGAMPMCAGHLRR